MLEPIEFDGMSPAIACCRRLGFEVVADFNEWEAERLDSPPTGA
jgi:hypothetical protein